MKWVKEVFLAHLYRLSKKVLKSGRRDLEKEIDRIQKKIDTLWKKMQDLEREGKEDIEKKGERGNEESKKE